MKVLKIQYEVLYNGKNITADISPNVIYISYTDRASGEADEISISLSDAAGLWQYAWYPTKGDTITLNIIKKGQPLNCGTFTIDEVTGDFSKDNGDTITIKALAAGINKNIRTCKFTAHEKKTLKEIANTIAQSQGLTVIGNIPDIIIERKTQSLKTDLHFLQELADDYGYTFSIRNNQLIFTNIYELESRESALTIQRNEVTYVNITDKTANTYGSVNIKYHHPRKKKTIVYEQKENNPALLNTKSDILVLRKRVDNDQQAEAMAKAALYRANSFQQEGSIQMPGNIFIVAGNSIELSGFGMFSGKYYITESSHDIDKDNGYNVTATIKRVGLIERK
ncbi:phage late control D family protein [Arachidicoccus terrestris]|uniref:phage late control D family protein n=1 Tax=Arachidicoccus terrestris TaxID=2875539 RepID=UPI001CC5449C|nr:contractile injection system protein, VgrG/Pvc8 family [Arachidicoccus terrestris]UAY56269.1 hypothetical protein K9M52_04420 [Arachidicoccus terrestris]